MEGYEEKTDAMTMEENKTYGSGEQGEYDNDRVAETRFIDDLNDDNQDSTEGGDSLGTGGAGSSVCGPSRDTFVEQVREAVAGTQDQGGVDNSGFVGDDIQRSTIDGTQYEVSLSECHGG